MCRSRCKFDGAPAGAKIGRAHTALVALGVAAWLAPGVDAGGARSAPPASVIVTLRGDLTPARTAQLQTLGAGIYRRLPLIHAVAVRVPARRLPALRALPWVAHVSPDAAVQKSDEFTVGSSEADQSYGTDAQGNSYKLTGRGVTVAVVDSGISLDRDLKGNGRGKNSAGPRVSFVPNSPSPDDPCGHGTHVAGIIAGNGAASTGPKFFRTFYGVAPGARVIGVRVLDAQGCGDVSTVIAGIQWVVDHKNQYKIRVMNLSLGHPVGESYTTDPLCQAAEAAWKAGILVVCAAGNEGRLNSAPTPGMDNEGWGTAYGSIDSPGNDPRVLTVGATKRALLGDGITPDPDRAHDRIATYSGRGPSRLDLVLKPDIVAPGNRVISLDVNNGYLDTTYAATNQVALFEYANVQKEDQASDKYFRLSGTSMAAPVVAGAAALLLEKDPTLTPDTIKARLMVSADKWADPQGNADPCTYGAGYVNIPAALACSFVPSLPALSPSLVLDSGGGARLSPLFVTWGDSAFFVTWGDSLSIGDIWGNSFVPNTSVLSASPSLANQPVWTDRRAWSAGATTADLSQTTISGEN